MTNTHKTELQRNHLEKKEALIRSLPVRSDIFLPTSKVPLQDQVKGLEFVKQLYNNDLNSIYSPRIEGLKNGLKGRKRCFLIGNGPSLNKTDLSLLKNEVTFAVNGFFLKAKDLDWTPTFYVVEDHLVAEDRAEALQQFKGPIKFFPAYLGYCIKPADDVIFYNHRPRKSYPDGFDFSLKANEITYTGCTVMFSAMQLAAYLGFDEIYLIGVDASYEIPKDVEISKDYGTSVMNMATDDPNHFHPDYFGKGFRWHDPQVSKMLEAYEEAKTVCETQGINIINATVGGKLEVFNRVEYSSLFTNSPNTTSKLPNILIIDFTRFGHGTATGEIKTKFFSSWDQSSLMHIYGEGGDNFGINQNGIDSETRRSRAFILEQIGRFSPDIILYRPVADHPSLHDLAMKIISELKKPYIIWMMDDWPTRLLEQNPILGNRMHSDLERLCQSANACFAISEAMAGAFGGRYGALFDVFHNGIILNKWVLKKLRKSTDKAISIRYSGGLAADMTLDSLNDIAEATKDISHDTNIKFEIRCQKHWLSTGIKAFENNPVVELKVADQTIEEYRQWLIDADILVICNNFDASSYSYIRHSFANKIPEYLASGQAILAYGPHGTATMDYLSKVPGVSHISKQNKDELVVTIKALARSRKIRESKGAQSQEHAFERLDFEKIRADFEIKIKKTAQKDFQDFTYNPHLPRKRFNLPRDLIRSIKRYILGWKGLFGITASGFMALGVFLCITSYNIAIRLFAFSLIFSSQLMLLLLIAHLSAHLDKKNGS